jgi:putative transposase
LDECGFSPTQPTGYSWSPRGQRHPVAYEAPKGRRVNAVVAYRPLGTRPTLRWRLYPRTLRSDDILALLKTLPSGKHPCVVVLDNAGIHTSKAVQRALPALSRVGVSLFYLPAYSPQLNEVEPVFGVIKGHEMPERSYATLSALMAAVRRAFRHYRHQLTSRR